MNIRLMRRDDISQVMDIAASLPEAPHWPESAWSAALDLDATPPRIALIAEDPSVLGFAVAMMVGPDAELETIAVAKWAQQKGIASCLLAELFTALKRRQISEVLLEVRESNQRARALYGNAGFTETGRRTGYYSDPKEDAILLRRTLL